jgi:hypothetical protein
MEYMEYIDNLDKAILDMMESKIILADISVKNVLIAISKCGDYCRTIKECTSSFDYDKEYNRYFAEEKKVPTSQRILIALVVGTLYKIDSLTLNLIDLLKTIYNDMDTTKSYPLFITDYIIPFVDALNFITFGQPYDEVKLPNIGSFDKLNEEIKWEVNRIINERLPKEDIDVNAELYTMLNGLNHSITLGDNIVIKVAYIGLKNTILKYNYNLNDELQNIKNILTIYGVL